MLVQQDRLLVHFCIAVVNLLDRKFPWKWIGRSCFHLPFSFPLPLTIEFLLLGDVTYAAYIWLLSASASTWWEDTVCCQYVTRGLNWNTHRIILRLLVVH